MNEQPQNYPQLYRRIPQKVGEYLETVLNDKQLSIVGRMVRGDFSETSTLRIYTDYTNSTLLQVLTRLGCSVIEAGNINAALASNDDADEQQKFIANLFETSFDTCSLTAEESL